MCENTCYRPSPGPPKSWFLRVLCMYLYGANMHTYTSTAVYRKSDLHVFDCFWGSWTGGVPGGTLFLTHFGGCFHQIHQIYMFGAARLPIFTDSWLIFDDFGPFRIQNLGKPRFSWKNQKSRIGELNVDSKNSDFSVHFVSRSCFFQYLTTLDFVFGRSGWNVTRTDLSQNTPKLTVFGKISTCWSVVVKTDSWTPVHSFYKFCGEPKSSKTRYRVLTISEQNRDPDRILTILTICAKILISMFCQIRIIRNHTWTHRNRIFTKFEQIYLFSSLDGRCVKSPVLPLTSPRTLFLANLEKSMILGVDSGGPRQGPDRVRNSQF